MWESSTHGQDTQAPFTAVILIVPYIYVSSFTDPLPAILHSLLTTTFNPDTMISMKLRLRDVE